MQEKTFKEALDEFLQKRINDCNTRKNESLQNAYQRFEDCAEKLKSSLSAEQKQVYLDFENAYFEVDGETMNCYYRAGFSDAVMFFTGWRDGEWN